MNKISLFRRISAAVMMGVFLFTASVTMAASTTVVVPSIFADPGDSYTNPSGSNQGQPIGTTGWYNNNVRGSGVSGINTTYPRSGNGSAYLSVPGSSGKAGIEYLADGAAFGGNYVATGYLGLLSDLKYLSYDYYRNGTSTAAAHLHPVVSIILDMDGDLSTITDRGGVNYEAIYNGDSVFVDVWKTVVVYDGVGDGKNMWSFGLGKASFADGYDVSLAEWIAGSEIIAGNPVNIGSANAKVLGFGIGLGSGWGPFEGGGDNLTFQFGDGDRITHNFEVKSALTPVPEVSTIASASVLGALVIGFIIRQRRATASAAV